MPPTPGYEQVPPIALHAHLDMVPIAAEGVKHDFNKDPIELIVEGEFVRAKNRTSLGADNLIGVAAALYLVLYEDFPHGPLELLFTVEEETTMKGAQGLDPDMIKARKIINLDSEKSGEICISSAGCAEVKIIFDVPNRGSLVQPGLNCFEIQVSGLPGGHSGLTIIENRPSAIQVLGHFLSLMLAIDEKAPFFYLCSIDGGERKNAIAKSAQARIATIYPGKFLDNIGKVIADVKAYFSGYPEMEIKVNQISAEDTMGFISTQLQWQITNLLVALPHGVLGVLGQNPKIPQTSNNLATINTSEVTIAITCMPRSAQMGELEKIIAQIATIAHLTGAIVQVGDIFPAWAPSDSSLLRIATKTYGDLFGTVTTTATHGGLECGFFSQFWPGVEIISIGPDIIEPHSVNEAVKYEAVPLLLEWARKILITQINI